MENQIFKLESKMVKSMLLKDDEIWFSVDEVESLEKFDNQIHNPGRLQRAYKVPLSTINEVSYNEASESAKFKYTNEKGKVKKVTIDLGDEFLSNQFGEHLGEKLGLNKSTKQEGQLKPLLLNGSFLLVAVLATYSLGTMEDTSQLTKYRSIRSMRSGAIAKTIVDTIGQTGVLIIGGLISLYLAYQLYNRFKNPFNEIVYSKQS